jgi:hypothetical protein
MSGLRRWMPRWVRRMLVAVYFGLFANGIAVLFLGVGGGGRGLETVSLLGMFVAVMLGGLFYAVSSPADFRPAFQLDERQRLVRLQAMADAYRAVCILFVLLHLAYSLQWLYGYRLRLLADTSGTPAALVFLPLVLLMPTLPQALVAWRESDLGSDAREAAVGA